MLGGQHGLRTGSSTKHSHSALCSRRRSPALISECLLCFIGAAGVHASSEVLKALLSSLSWRVFWGPKPEGEVQRPVFSSSLVEMKHRFHTTRSLFKSQLLLYFWAWFLLCLHSLNYNMASVLTVVRELRWHRSRHLTHDTTLPVFK